jgi:hypothetical protein
MTAIGGLERMRMEMAVTYFMTLSKLLLGKGFESGISQSEEVLTSQYIRSAK